MSRAELEARVRMELNRKLSAVNSFLRQHAEHCDKIDELRDYNRQGILLQLTHAEQQLRVCYNNNNNNNNNTVLQIAKFGPNLLSTIVFFVCLGGAVIRRRTRDRKVAGSTPGRGAIKSTR